MNIIICGDSWTTGAWNDEKLREPTHPGLSYFLQSSGHRVENLSIRGCGNNNLALVLEKFLKLEDTFIPDLIIFMQCDFVRDYFYYRNSTKENLKNLYEHREHFKTEASNFETLLAPIFSNFYSNLKKIIKNIPIYILGGNTTLHPVVNDFFGNSTFSGTRIIDNTQQDSYFSNPRDIELFKYFLLIETSIKKKAISDEIEKHMKMTDFWDKNDFFIHKHGNLQWHRAIYNKVIKDCKL